MSIMFLLSRALISIFVGEGEDGLKNEADSVFKDEVEEGDPISITPSSISGFKADSVLFHRRASKEEGKIEEEKKVKMESKTKQMILSCLCKHFSFDPAPFVGGAAESDVKTLFGNVLKPFEKEMSAQNNEELLSVFVVVFVPVGVASISCCFVYLVLSWSVVDVSFVVFVLIAGGRQ
ncbi:hypothetical protein Bca4012_063349 [Brassica carinata]